MELIAGKGFISFVGGKMKVVNNSGLLFLILILIKEIDKIFLIAGQFPFIGNIDLTIFVILRFFFYRHGGLHRLDAFGREHG